MTDKISADRRALKSSPRASALVHHQSSDALGYMNIAEDKQLINNKIVFDKEAREELRVERAYKKHERNKQLWN